jgi:RNA polymerase sigma factor for flagellar operon FliA
MSGAALYSSVQSGTADSIVLRYAPLVKRIAYHLRNRLPPSMGMDDLLQTGMIGLLEATRQYDASQGASFETYAGIRIRGAMLDEVRRQDWTPRSVHRKSHDVAEAIRAIEARTRRSATDAEVAEHLGISLEEYGKILLDASGCRLFSLEELQETGDVRLERGGEKGSLPAAALSEETFKSALAKAITGLPEKEQLVISLYYDEELNMREIGQVLGVSESRVCQINTQAILRLRARLKGWLDGGRDDEP